jgi:hypothetical protein
MSRALIALATAAALAGCGDGVREGDDGLPDLVDGSHWRVPPCAIVDGEPIATFSMDGGFTHAPLARLPSDILVDGRSEETMHLVALPRVADALIAIQRDRRHPSGETRYDIAISRDSGCTWAEPGRRLGPDVVQLVAGGGRVAFALEQTRIGSDLIHRISVDGVLETFDSSELGAVVIALVPHPSDPDRLRTVTHREIRETQQIGRNGRLLNSLPATPASRWVQQVSADADDWDRIALLSTVYEEDLATRDEVLVTHDGGRSWIAPTGLEPLGYRNILFRIVLGRADSDVVWLRAKELLTPLTLTSDPVIEEWLLMSRDGGRSFRHELKLPRKEWAWELVPHPTDAEAVLWSSRDRVFRYSASTGQVTIVPDLDSTDFPAQGYDTRHIVFSPADARVFYLSVGSIDVIF